MLLLASYSNGQKNVSTLSIDQPDTSKVSQVIDLNGTWVMTNYLDSILKYKSIAKYRMLPASWFAIIIEIENDSIRTYGSIYDNSFVAVSKTDTICIIDRTLSGLYSLTYIETTGNLELKQINTKNRKVDSVTYMYQKRTDLEFLTNNLDKVHKTGSNFTKYFNKNLVAGQYNLYRKVVRFLEDDRVENFQNYKEYQVGNYFGTYHPFQDRDILILTSNDGEVDYWEWKIISNNLILTKLTIDWKKSDDYELTKETYKLTKK
jgi:hypothetical protein